ncbi:hypothetical protein TNCV_1491921 [Trichonephila clavipes]|nr:hypothetical protein TNCV_1491921 [Trichonephila clavipes]
MPALTKRSFSSRKINFLFLDHRCCEAQSNRKRNSNRVKKNKPTRLFMVFVDESYPHETFSKVGSRAHFSQQFPDLRNIKNQEV